MNLIGYYNSEEVWIPDPFLMEKEATIQKNDPKKHKEVVDLCLDQSIIQSGKTDIYAS